MPDTLLFRGGSSADVAVSNVQSRELVIDTDTDQIVSGPSRKKTVMEGSDGALNSLDINGANIELNADGSITAGAASFTTSGRQHLESPLVLNNTNPDGYSIYSQSNGTGTFAVVTDGSVFVGDTSASVPPIVLKNNGEILATGDVMVGGALPSAPNITLNADGSITAAGDLTLGSVPTGNGVAAYGSGSILLRKDGDNTPFLEVLNNGSTNADRTVIMTSDGSATFAGDVKIGGTLPSAPNITLNANGSATFAGNVQAPYVHVIADAAQTSGALVRLDGVSPACIELNYDGSAAFDGIVQTSDTATGSSIKLNPAGNLEVVPPSDTDTAIKVFSRDQGQRTLDINGAGEVKIGGTLLSAPNITLNASGNAYFNQNVYISNGEPASGAADGLRLASFGGIFASGPSNLWLFKGFTTGDTEPKIQLNANGSATFAGNVTAPNITNTYAALLSLKSALSIPDQDVNQLRARLLEALENIT